MSASLYITGPGSTTTADRFRILDYNNQPPYRPLLSPEEKHRPRRPVCLDRLNSSARRAQWRCVKRPSRKTRRWRLPSRRATARPGDYPDYVPSDRHRSTLTSPHVAPAMPSTPPGPASTTSALTAVHTTGSRARHGSRGTSVAQTRQHRSSRTRPGAELTPSCRNVTWRRSSPCRR
jgi:hypothetical protein